jgi:hypothetical protein
MMLLLLLLLLEMKKIGWVNEKKKRLMDCCWLDIRCNKDRGKWRNRSILWFEVVGRKKRRSTLVGNWPRKDPRRRARDDAEDNLRSTDAPWPNRPDV